jgi:hypothetical protein
MTEGRALLRARQFFAPRRRSANGWNERSTYSRDLGGRLPAPLAALQMQAGTHRHGVGAHQRVN